MIVCSDPALQTWPVDLRFAEQGVCTWTRLLWEESELCNSLEMADWENNPVQVQVCEHCGWAGCRSGGYVYVSRLDRQVIWTRPEIDWSDVFEATHFDAAFLIKRQGSVVFPNVTWLSLRDSMAEIPEPEAYPRATRMVIATAWKEEFHQVRPDQGFADLVSFLERDLIASDRLSADEAIARVRDLVAWIDEDPQEPVGGRVVPAGEAGAEVEKFYSDGPARLDRPTIARLNGTYTFAFRGEWVWQAASAGA